MTLFQPYTKRQLDMALQLIRRAIYMEVAPLEIEAWCTHEPVPYVERRTGEHRVLQVGDKWGDLFDSAWFHFTGQVPKTAIGQHVVLLLDVSGELCVVDESGMPLRGLTPVASSYDYSLGEPGKRVFQVVQEAAGGEVIDVWADAGCNDLFGNVVGDGRIRQAAIAICHDEVRALYYDFEVLLDLLKVLPEDSPRYQQILTGLTDVTHLLYQGIVEMAIEARAILRPLLAQHGGDPSLQISAIGHAHIDLAWLWPIRETIRKGARTFSTALDLMDIYPDYIFGASQPQLYLWMKERYPKLYARIKRKVQEGRIEPQGAMWVEADTNITGGESLVRQLLYGKRFFREEFGVDIDYLWLPDVFGYTASLPQILKKAGVTKFSTQKLSWSLINTFPYHSFHWQGIDGTTVLTHMLPEETYNSPAAPRSVRKIERNYREKGLSHHALMVFGIGDGGGGPGAEHLERLQRMVNLAGLSPVRQEPVASFFEKLVQEADRFPTWVGELYLERHQGTFTTEAKNKWYNRKIELALRELEWYGVLANLSGAVPYPASRLLEIWREVLLYQFHDILPGSSIKRVYDESLARYAVLLQEVERNTVERQMALARGIDTEGMQRPVVVYNSLSWPRAEWLQVEDAWAFVEAPGMGYTVLDLAEQEPEPAPVVAMSNHLENDVLRVEFSDDGAIVSLYDKRLGRELIPAGEMANDFVVFTDPGDAWDFPMDYAEQTPRKLTLVTSQAQVVGPKAMLTQVYRIGHSELQQEIVLTAGSPRLDFITHLRWRETRTMLRVRFPLAVRADEATYEIQFGHIRRPTHRNTTWDLARDEVPAHKWVDLSQRDFGVALLNDSKYGHKVKGHTIDLNLLRSVPYPGSNRYVDQTFPPGEPHLGFTDQADHTFTYALFPHPGDAVAGGVIQAAYALNVPLQVMPVEPQPGSAPRTNSWLSLDNPNVIIETVKKAEDDDAVIVRLYETAGASAEVSLRVGFPVGAAFVVDLMEQPSEQLDVDEGVLRLSFAPFEIKSLRLESSAA